LKCRGNFRNFHRNLGSETFAAVSCAFGTCTFLWISAFQDNVRNRPCLLCLNEQTSFAGPFTSLCQEETSRGSGRGLQHALIVVCSVRPFARRISSRAPRHLKSTRRRRQPDGLMRSSKEDHTIHRKQIDETSAKLENAQPPLLPNEKSARRRLDCHQACDAVTFEKGRS
jgi:hypothetical protein